MKALFATARRSAFVDRHPTIGYSTVRSIAAAMATLGLAGCMAPTEPAKLGEAHYNTCLPCHGTAAEGNVTIEAPAIAGLPQWYIEAQLHKFRAGARGSHFDDLPGLRMRPMAAALHSESDVTAVAGYVAGMKRPGHAPMVQGGDAAKGKTSFMICVACHGPDGGGNQALNAPALVGADDWYLLAQLKKFKAGVRGTNPKDVTGAQMRAMSMTLADEQAMKDVVAYIMTLPAKGGG